MPSPEACAVTNISPQLCEEPALALLGQGLKKSPIGQKLDFANHPYLCKGLNENAKSLKIIV
jgi:hypothetical protein